MMVDEDEKERNVQHMQLLERILEDSNLEDAMKRAIKNKVELG